MANESVKVPAALRTLLVLQALGRAGQPMTAQAIAQRLAIPRSSTYQLLEILESQGFVVHFPEEKRWSLGIAAFELGSAYLRHDPLERLAQPLLNRLLLQVGALRNSKPSIGSGQASLGFAAVAQLGILSGAEILYLLKGATAAHSQANLGVVTDVGVRLPAHLTASGRSMLALLDRAQLRATFPGGNDSRLPLRTGIGPATIRDLNALLAEERERGVSVEQGMVTENYTSIAAAARNHLGIPVAAFAVTFRTDLMDAADTSQMLDRLTPLLRSAAADLGRRLGAK